MKTYNTVRYEVADKILTLTLNRPDQMNAFTVEMARELVHAFERASEDDDVGAATAIRDVLHEVVAAHRLRGLRGETDALVGELCEVFEVVAHRAAALGAGACEAACAASTGATVAVTVALLRPSRTACETDVENPRHMSALNTFV